jgi:hypothetical protein
VGIEDRALPSIEMHVLACLGQHGERHAEIVVLSRQAFIDDAALTLFGFEWGELLIGPPTSRAVGPDVIWNQAPRTTARSASASTE